MTEVVAPPAAAPAPTTEVTATPVVEAPKPEVVEKTFNEQQVNDIVEKRLAKERRKRQEIENRLRVTEELVVRGKQPEPKAQPKADDEPKREQFDTYEAFIEARAEWKADRKVEERFTKEREEQHNRTAAEADKKRVEAFQKRTKELGKSIEDFDEVMAAATADRESPFSRLLADPIDECENPAAVLYHLAKNPEEAERIASLPGQKQAREIWALDTKLKSAPEPKKPSKAPEPITPVGGKTVTGDAEPDASDTKAWIAWRNRQLAAKARGTQ